jgi:dUTP pyrophosphatase
MANFIELKRIGNHELPLPGYGSSEAAGADLSAVSGVEILPGDRAVIPTGFAWSIWPGYVGLVWPRSGLAVRSGVDVLAGVIDSDYRGEVCVILINHGSEPVTIKSGDRVAQLVIQRCSQIATKEVDELAGTERGSGGFGSTGN